jgi:hydrogenase maturation protease
VTDPASHYDGRSGAGQAGMRVRVVGCGNPLAGDDSVGLEIVRRLRAQGESECDLVTLPQPGVELLDALQGAEVVLFIDAVSSGAPPGTLHLTPVPSPALQSRTLSALSGHGWGLPEMVGLTAALGRRTPRLVLLGIELATAEPGTPRSEAAEGAVQTVVEKFSQLRAILTEVNAGRWPSGRLFLPGDASFPGGR